jgi:nucleotide-binding universal stress UspA family protein
MNKLTSILAVIEDAPGGAAVFDKAVTLARPFRARVELLVTDMALMSEIGARCKAIADVDLTLTSVFRTAGEPLHELVLRRLHERPVDLLIKAPSGNHPLRRWTLQENDAHLVEECPVAVLLAGTRRWNSAAPRMAAAVDVSDPETAGVARRVLQAAGFLALGVQASLDVLYSEREEQDSVLRMERAVKLAQLVREFHVGCERLQMFDGAPEERLPRLVAAREYDVLVLGGVSHQRSMSLHSLTSRLVESTPGDVLLVTTPAHSTAMQARTPLRWKQASNHL